MFPVTENLIPSGLITAKRGWFSNEQDSKSKVQPTDLPYRLEFFYDLLWLIFQSLDQTRDEFGLFEDGSRPTG